MRQEMATEIVKQEVKMVPQIVRVFPRRTNATPDNAYAFIGEPDFSRLPAGITEVHISVTYSWDLPRAEVLAALWDKIAPVKIGGPALDTRGESFITPRFTPLPLNRLALVQWAAVSVRYIQALQHAARVVSRQVLTVRPVLYCCG